MCRRLICVRISTRSWASRLESGSSNRNSAGSRAIARPIATRWRWPPESCFGLRSSRCSICRIVGGLGDGRRDLRLRRVAHLQAEAEVLAHRHVRVERVVLEHHGDVAVARRVVVDHAAVDGDLAARDGSRPAIIRRMVHLPQPEGPTSTTNSPSPISKSMPCTTCELAVLLDELPDTTCAITLGHQLPLDPPAADLERQERSGRRGPSGSSSRSTSSPSRQPSGSATSTVPRAPAGS